jgi:hypothetical protein
VRITAPVVRSALRAVPRRSFSSSHGRQQQWGFIGLGQMGTYAMHATRSIDSIADSRIGYNMARNLQAKLPSSDTIRAYDINTESTRRFVDDTKGLGTGAAVEAASCVRDAAENSVCRPKPYPDILSL